MKNPLCFIWNKAIKPVLDMCAGPELIAKKQETLEAAERGEIIDSDTGDVTQVNPNSPEGRANIKRCREDLRAQEANFERTLDLVEKDLSQDNDGIGM